jgi:hypothetical protein
MDGLDRVEYGSDHVAERISTGVADGPEAEGEAVLGARCVRIGHGDDSSLWAASAARRSCTAEEPAGNTPSGPGHRNGSVTTDREVEAPY